MTDQQVIAEYIKLLILQYVGKEKISGHIGELVNLIISGQLPNQIQNAFDPLTAIGAQLDILGKWAGVSREGFSFSGPMVLDDEDYRKIINLKIIKNNSGSSLADIKDLLQLYFENTIRVFDYKDMSMSYYVSSAFGSQELVEFFINKDLLPSPMAVGVGSIIFHPTLKFFSFRTYRAESRGFPFNTYANYNEDWPWLTYTYALNAGVTADLNLITEDGLNTIVQENGDALYA